MATWIIFGIIVIAVVYAVYSRSKSDCGCGGGKNCESKGRK